MGERRQRSRHFEKIGLFSGPIRDKRFFRLADGTAYRPVGHL
jgi:hypothetical protein